jgi:adenine-specific DNA-methyltransferase
MLFKDFMEKFDKEFLKEDGSINHAKLYKALDMVETTTEEYHFNWYGKDLAKFYGTDKFAEWVQKHYTLRPDKETSKNFDTTENLYIEGDNLEVLALLQKCYKNKIKIIYIDPPYNTGKDFIYKDNYTMSKKKLKDYKKKYKNENDFSIFKTGV